MKKTPVKNIPGNIHHENRVLIQIRLLILLDLKMKSGEKFFTEKDVFNALTINQETWLFFAAI